MSFPSACCVEAGEAGLPRRCWRLVGIPRAEARLLAMEELMSRGGKGCVACCCCWEREDSSRGLEEGTEGAD